MRTRGPWSPMGPKDPMGPWAQSPPWGAMGPWGPMGLRIANFKIIIAGSIANCGAANSFIDCRSNPHYNGRAGGGGYTKARSSWAKASKAVGRTQASKAMWLTWPNLVNTKSSDHVWLFPYLYAFLGDPFWPVAYHLFSYVSDSSRLLWITIASYFRLLWIISDYYGLFRAITDYCRLSLTFSDCNQETFSLLIKNTCLLVQPEDMSSVWTRSSVCLFNKRNRVLTQQENMSCCLRRPVCLSQTICCLARFSISATW